METKDTVELRIRVPVEMSKSLKHRAIDEQRSLSSLVLELLGGKAEPKAKPVPAKIEAPIPAPKVSSDWGTKPEVPKIAGMVPASQLSSPCQHMDQYRDVLKITCKTCRWFRTRPNERANWGDWQPPQ